MVILGTRNKITDFFMILAWASPFNCTCPFVVSVADPGSVERGDARGFGGLPPRFFG